MAVSDSEGRGVKTFRLPVREATPEALAPYGTILGSLPEITPLPINFYDGTVTVRKPAEFITESPAEFTVCRLQPRPLTLEFLERHPRHTQAFVPLGGKPFVAVFAPPTVDNELPDIEALQAFRFDGSAGFIMHINTWHEFPFAIHEDTDIIVVLSQDTNQALHDDNVVEGEAHGPDLDKRNLVARLGLRVELEMN